SAEIAASISAVLTLYRRGGAVCRGSRPPGARCTSARGRGAARTSAAGRARDWAPPPAPPGGPGAKPPPPSRARGTRPPSLAARPPRAAPAVRREAVRPASVLVPGITLRHSGLGRDLVIICLAMISGTSTNGGGLAFAGIMALAPRS